MRLEITIYCIGNIWIGMPVLLKNCFLDFNSHIFWRILYFPKFIKIGYYSKNINIFKISSNKLLSYYFYDI